MGAMPPVNINGRRGPSSSANAIPPTHLDYFSFVAHLHRTCIQIIGKFHLIWLLEMKVKKTTQSLRKHAFSSFRERVDAVKIDPSRNLVKRVYESTDTSHFLATLEHWQEVNISGNFTEFVDKVETYSQSLPQVIYHQRSIYQALITYQGQ